MRIYSGFAMFFAVFFSISVVCAADGMLPEARHINRAAKAGILGSVSLWEDSPAALLKRLRLRKSADEDGMMSIPYDGKLFDEDVKELRIYYKHDKITRLSIFLMNKGDSAADTKSQARFSRKLKREDRSLSNYLNSRLGKGSEGYYGFGKAQKKILFWEFDSGMLVMDFTPNEYIVMHIVPQGAISKTKKATRKRTITADLSRNVVKGKNGDVYIKNIPMVDQGDKGYCATAMLERLFRYYGITDMDMHRIAQLANTQYGGGTNMAAAFKGVYPVLRDYGLTISVKGTLSPESVSSAINSGLPLIWCMYSGDSYIERMKINSQLRKKTAVKRWVRKLRRQKKLKPDENSPHACLIIGYNFETQEIAVSNTWGKGYEIHWVSLQDALSVDRKVSLFTVNPLQKRK